MSLYKWENVVELVVGGSVINLVFFAITLKVKDMQNFGSGNASLVYSSQAE